MKLIVEKQGEIVNAIKAEYTPTEALIINQAMRRYACDDEMNKEDRTIMEQMLEVEPIFVEQEPKTIQEKQAESEKYEKAFDDGYENGYAQARFDYEQEPYDFAKWVATEIFDDNWEYNKDAFAEIACRKLAKLGIVRAKSDKWELVEPQERSEEE